LFGFINFDEVFIVLEFSDSGGFSNSGVGFFNGGFHESVFFFKVEFLLS
jgi:hypothetical protein